MRRLLLFCLLLLAAACSQPYGAGEIRFALSRAPISLDPRYATDATSERLNRLLYQRLVDYDSNSRPVAGIANWEKLSDTHYRFTLLETAANFHHGRELTADDVVATYRHVLDSDDVSPHKGLLRNVLAVDSPHTGIIDFHLNRNDNLFPGRLTIGILPADLLASGHNFHKQPVGSGAFRFISSDEQASVILQRLHDGQYLRFVEVRNPTVRLLKLINGEVDILQGDISPELFAWLENQQGVKTYRQPGTNFTYLGMNLRSEKLRDPRTRQAIAHAIDRAALIRFLMADRARPAESILAPEHWAAHQALPAYEYNPRRARQLLQEAGWNSSQPLELTYKTSTDPLRTRIAAILTEQLSAVGIKTSLQSLDWGTFYGDIKSGNFELYSLSWVGIRSPDIFEYVFHSQSVPPGGANRGHYTNTQVDGLIDAALYKNRLAVMHSAFLAIQEKLHNDLPYIPLWYEDQYYAAREDIFGYELKADGNYDGLAHVYRNRPEALK